MQYWNTGKENFEEITGYPPILQYSNNPVLLIRRIRAKVNLLEFFRLFDFLGFSCENHFSDIQHEDTIADAGDKRQVMLDDEDCLPFLFKFRNEI